MNYEDIETIEVSKEILDKISKMNTDKALTTPKATPALTAMVEAMKAEFILQIYGKQ
jgi:hypothetical protein